MDIKLSTLSMFFKKGKKITVCLNQCDTFLTCVLIAFSQHIHSFWLSPFLNGYPSQIGLVISWKLLPILLRFLLMFSPNVFILGWGFTMSLSPNQHGLRFHKADGVLVLLSRISIWGTCISFAEFPATVLSEGSCCSEHVWIFLSFSLHISNSFCLERFSVSTGRGKVEHITSWQSCSALCFELVTFFLKV